MEKTTNYLEDGIVTTLKNTFYKVISSITGDFGYSAKYETNSGFTYSELGVNGGDANPQAFMQATDGVNLSSIVVTKDFIEFYGKIKGGQLPTSTTGLQAGDWWNDNGTVKIF